MRARNGGGSQPRSWPAPAPISSTGRPPGGGNRASRSPRSPPAARRRAPAGAPSRSSEPAQAEELAPWLARDPMLPYGSRWRRSRKVSIALADGRDRPRGATARSSAVRGLRSRRIAARTLIVAWARRMLTARLRRWRRAGTPARTAVALDCDRCGAATRVGGGCCRPEGYPVELVQRAPPTRSAERSGRPVAATSGAP